MTLRVQILRCSRWLFIVLVSPTMTWFSEKMLIFTRSSLGILSNLIKKPGTDSSLGLTIIITQPVHFYTMFGNLGQQCSVYLSTQVRISKQLVLLLSCQKGISCPPDPTTNSETSVSPNFHNVFPTQLDLLLVKTLKTREHSGFVVSESGEQDHNIMTVHEKNTRHFLTVFRPTKLNELKNMQEMKIKWNRLKRCGTGWIGQF